jgi:hypothetical protein
VRDVLGTGRRMQGAWSSGLGLSVVRHSTASAVAAQRWQVICGRSGVQLRNQQVSTDSFTGVDEAVLAAVRVHGTSAPAGC